MTGDTDNQPQTQPEDSVHTTPPALTIDWALYEEYFEDSDLSEDDQRAFIEALWSIMVAFVDMGFRINPVQEICGEIALDEPSVPKALSDMVKSEPITQPTQNPAKADDALLKPSGERSPK